jgi:predicted MFS family arabinose efflux permease
MRTALAALAALAVAMGIGRFAFTPILPMMQADAGLSMAAGSWLASANYFGYLVGALSAIGLRLRPATAIRAALLAIGVSTLAMGLEKDFLVWVVMRTVAGIASAWVLVFVSAWALERLAELGRPQMSGVVYAGVGAGIAAAGGVCLFLMRLHAGSSAAWLLLGIASLGATAFLWNVFDTKIAARSTHAPPMQAVFKFWPLVVAYGFYGYGYIIPATFLPAMARDALGDPDLFGWAWPAFGAAAVASTLFASRLARFMSPRAIWIGCHLAMALGVVIPLFVAGLAGILLAALFVGGTFVVVTQVGLQEARAVAGAQARPLMAAMTSAFALGQIAGPLTLAWLAGAQGGSQGGFTRPLVVAAALLALSALALLRR